MWTNEFNNILPLLGHRNWILVVDKAYPLQSANGISYLDSGLPLQETLSYVLAQIEQASHIKPIIYTDRELDLLPQIGQQEAQMVETLRTTLHGHEVQSILHDDVFAKLDAASKLFNVVVIKTESTIAYSSVFIELDCGYWTPEKEGKLRQLMK